MKLSKYYLTLHEDYFNYISDKSVACKEEVVSIFKSLGFHKSDREHTYIALLNVKGQITGIEEVSVGDQSRCLLSPREYYKVAVYTSAAATIMCHNHPSGDPTPSNEDIYTTKRLKDAGNVLGIELLDSIVIGSTGDYYSVFDLL